MMNLMKFSEKLEAHISESGFNKTDLANKIGVTPQYIMNLCKGLKPPPTIDRCREIAKVLSLTTAETQALIDVAVEERLAPDELMWLSEREKKYSSAKKICTDEILEALTDPVAVKALLATYKSKEEVKAVVQSVIENLNHLSKEQRKEMLRYCQ